ncbi:MAG: DNA primase [Candidatus Paceibacterota bacterium]
MSSNNVEKIKERLGIVEVVSSYVKLEKAGSNLKACCPFHKEKTPSFLVSPLRDSFYCFGCGAKGDIFTFVQEFEHLDFMGALKVLAERAGVELVKENPDIKNEKDRLFLILETATLFFKNKFTEEAKEYLKKRGLNSETIEKWRLGYSLQEWRSLYDFLKSKGFQESDMEKVGLVRKSDKGYYDWFRDRIMFPLFDNSGRVIGFSGRIFHDDKKSAKYINSPETALYSKSENLYGLNFAKQAIRERGYTILVEGQMDAILVHQAGFLNTVASGGTALTDRHLDILKRMSNNLLIAYDGDKAGFGASERAWQKALSIGMDVKIAKLPLGLDPADLVLKDINLWKNSLKHAENIVNFYLSLILDKNLDKRTLGREVEKKLLPIISIIPSSIDQSNYIGEISIATGLKEESLWEELSKLKSNNKDNPNQNSYRNNNVKEYSKKDDSARRSSIEKKLIGIILWQKDLKEKTFEIEETEKKLKSILNAENLDEYFKLSDDEKTKLISEAEINYEEKLEILSREVSELLVNLEIEYLKDALLKSAQNIKDAERMKDKEKVKAYLEEYQFLSKKMHKLSNF